MGSDGEPLFIGEVRYSADYRHGGTLLASTASLSGDWLARWCHVASPAPFDLPRTLFVDTETAGLSGGGGNLAFLIGLGRFEDRDFCVEQIFVDSPRREGAALDFLGERAEQFHTVVTFNGKSFDLPLLEARCLLKRKRSPFLKMAHLDLLHPARQLWNLALGDCRLKALERSVLGFERKNDIPGEEIPSVYSDYVFSGRLGRLPLVFDHNALDIVSLAALTVALWEGSRPDHPSDHPSIEFSRGRIFWWHGMRRAAMEALEGAVGSEPSLYRRQMMSRDLSLACKRTGEWERAAELWREMVAPGRPFLLFPRVELAKYLEHRQQNYSEAIEVVRNALVAIAPHRTEEIAALRHRLERLEKKLARRREE